MAGEPTPSGIVDALLGGHTNMAPDREAARAIRDRYPAVPEMFCAGQAFSLRVARRAAEELGIRRFIRAGYVTPLPGRNVHDVLRATLGCRVVYITRGDQAAMAAGRFADGRSVTVVQARVAFPDQVLATEPVAAMIGENEPVCLVAGMFYHHADAEWAAQHMRVYASALPPGSVLAGSLIAVPDEETTSELTALFGAEFYPHTAGEVGAWLPGLDVFPLTPHVAIPGTALGVQALITA